jgi:hypothetical protein
VPASDGGDNSVGLCDPLEGFRLGVVVVEEAVDSGLEVGDGSEDAALEAAFGHYGEKAFDGVEPGGRGRGEVECPARMAREPLAYGGMLVSRVIVEDRVDRLAGGDFALDGVEKADELLMPVTLHVAADHGSVQYVHCGEQGRRAVALVIVGHGPGAALLQRQSGLSAIEGLDLALFIDAEHDGVRRRIDIEPDDVAQLVDERRVVGQLELPDPMRLEPVSAPDPLHGTGADAGCLGHRGAGPMGRFVRRFLHGQSDDPLGDRGVEPRDPRGPRLVAQEPVHAFGGELSLPAPDACLGLAGLAHDRVRADPIRAQQHDLRPPHVLLRRVAVLDQGAEPIKIGGRDGNKSAGSHAAESHAASPPRIDKGIQMEDAIH